MTVLLTLSLPIAASCADAATSPEKAEIAGQEPSGKVVEAMDRGAYTYAKLEKRGKITWVAFPSQETRVGDTLSLYGCTPMSEFQSKSLNRKFELIFFCNAPGGKPNAPETKPTTMAAKKPPGRDGALGATDHKIKVDKASGANAYTVERLYAKSWALNGKKVVVRGEVVKVSPRIMARNWIHLQDGSGSAKKKTHDLVVTSTDLPKVGDVVTVSGTLVKDKDFGSGYKFSVIIEKGSVRKGAAKPPLAD